MSQDQQLQLAANWSAQAIQKIVKLLAERDIIIPPGLDPLDALILYIDGLEERLDNAAERLLGEDN